MESVSDDVQKGKRSAAKNKKHKCDKWLHIPTVFWGHVICLLAMVINELIESEVEKTGVDDGVPPMCLPLSFVIVND